MATSLNIVILLSYLPHKYTGKLRDPYIKMLVIMPATLLYKYILSLNVVNRVILTPLYTIFLS